MFVMCMDFVLEDVLLCVNKREEKNRHRILFYYMNSLKIYKLKASLPRSASFSNIIHAKIATGNDIHRIIHVAHKMCLFIICTIHSDNVMHAHSYSL